MAHSFSNANRPIQGVGQRGQELKVKIMIDVSVRVNPVQITALYSHSSRKTKPRLTLILSVILSVLIHVYP